MRPDACNPTKTSNFKTQRVIVVKQIYRNNLQNKHIKIHTYVSPQYNLLYSYMYECINLYLYNEFISLGLYKAVSLLNL